MYFYIIYSGCCLNGELNPDPSQDQREGQEPWLGMSHHYHEKIHVIETLKKKKDKHFNFVFI